MKKLAVLGSTGSIGVQALDVARLAAIRAVVPKEICVRIDANQAWKPKEAVRILNQMQSSEDYHLTGGVAATVNGVNITEDTITKQIMSTRSALGYDSDEDWAQYLVDNDITPEEYRESVIDSYARQYLLSQAISDYNVTVSDEEVNEAWNEASASYDSEDAFIDQLRYRAAISSSVSPVISDMSSVVKPFDFIFAAI